MFLLTHADNILFHCVNQRHLSKSRVRSVFKTLQVICKFTVDGILVSMLIITSRWLKQFVYLAKKYEENGFMEKFNISIALII